MLCNWSQFDRKVETVQTTGAEIASRDEFEIHNKLWKGYQPTELDLSPHNRCNLKKKETHLCLPASQQKTVISQTRGADINLQEGRLLMKILRQTAVGEPYFN